MLYPSRAYVRLAHSYRNVSDEEFSEIVVPAYAEVVYRRYGYVHARNFRSKALTAREVYKRVTASQFRSQPVSRLPVARATNLPAQFGRSRARAHRGHARRRTAPAATPPPDEPAPAAHVATLRKVVGIHSCSECDCDGSHALVRITGGY